MKRCTKCGELKLLSEFFADARLKDGLQSRCKPCMRAATKDWMLRNPEKNAAREKRRRLRTPGRSTAYVKQWRERNPDSGKRYYAAHIEKHRERHKTLYATNPAYKARINKGWRELNKRRPEIKNAIVARRRALQKNALVPWADKVKMREFYAEAKRMERETGIKHHVDHVVPLQSRIVCGLHWEGNLQVLPAVANQEKNNKVWPDMPGAY